MVSSSSPSPESSYVKVSVSASASQEALNSQEPASQEIAHSYVVLDDLHHNPSVPAQVPAYGYVTPPPTQRTQASNITQFEHRGAYSEPPPLRKLKKAVNTPYAQSPQSAQSASAQSSDGSGSSRGSEPKPKGSPFSRLLRLFKSDEEPASASPKAPTIASYPEQDFSHLLQHPPFNREAKPILANHPIDEKIYEHTATILDFSERSVSDFKSITLEDINRYKLALVTISSVMKTLVNHYVSNYTEETRNYFNMPGLGARWKYVSAFKSTLGLLEIAARCHSNLIESETQKNLSAVVQQSFEYVLQAKALSTPLLVQLISQEVNVGTPYLILIDQILVITEKNAQNKNSNIKMHAMEVLKAVAALKVDRDYSDTFGNPAIQAQNALERLRQNGIELSLPV